MKRYQSYLPLMPLAYARLDMREYDLVISSSHACAKGVRLRSDALHICYCYTPMRYAWSGYQDYRRSLRSPVRRALMSLLMSWFRRWDRKTAQHVTQFIACSSEVADRIRRYYSRSSLVVFPPVTMESAQPEESELPVSDPVTLVPGLASGAYYLSLGRLVPYKRVDLAIEACNRLGRTLVVAGTGPEYKRIRVMAGPTAHFIPEFSDADARTLYANCRAFLFPGEEDFGITVVEAQLHGKPVIAFGRGGACDTVKDGETGLLVAEQNAAALADAIRRSETTAFDVDTIRQNAMRFSPQAFRSAILKLVDDTLRGAAIH